jgi:hypothetical protein
MDVRLPDGTVIQNVPEGTTQADLMNRLNSAGFKQSVIQDPLTKQVNSEAAKSISAAIPAPVKEAASAVGETVEAGWNALPEGVKQPLKTTGNFLLDAIDYLQRPFQAVAVGGKEVGKAAERNIKPSDVFGLTTLSRAFSKPEERQAVVSAAGRGIRGEEKASTQELLSDDFRKNNPVKAAVLGFAGDAVLDPLNLANPFGVAKSFIKTAPESTSIPSRLTDHELFKVFNVTTGDVDKARNLYNQYRYLKSKASNESVRNAKTLNNEIKVLSKESGIPVNELKAKIVHDIETASLSDDAIGQIEQRIIDRNRQILEEQRAAGVEIGDLGETYMPHVLTREADELVNNSKFKNFFGIRPSAKTPSAISREIEGTVADINAQNLYGTKKYFQDDPAIMTGVAEFRAANAIAGKKFLEDAKALGIREAEAPDNFETVPEISGYRFDPEIAKRLKTSYKTLTDQEDVRKWLNVYDGAQNWWKMWTLGIRPAYHTKNAIGNVWNAYLGGLNNPVRFGEAGIFQNKLARNDLTGKLIGKPVDELYEAMSTRGVFGQGQYGGDIVRNLEKEIEGGIRNPFTLSVENPILQAGFKVGQTIEDNARIALFLDRVKKGQNYDQAGRAVKKYLFDYGDLSPVEQSVFKRIMPFYTWSRKNIPLQFESLALHPDKMNKINLAKENIQAAYGVQTPDPSEVPSYVVEGMPIYTGRSEDPAVVSVFQLQNTLPFADLAPFFKFLNTQTEPSAIERGKLAPEISAALSGVSPLVKAPIEFLSNYDFFRRRTIKEYEGQKTDFLGVEMPVHLAKAVSNIVLLAEIDRLNPNGIFGTRQKDIKTGKITTTPSIFGAQRESRTDLEEDQRINQALFGIRVLDINLDEAAVTKAKKIRSDINAAKALIRRGFEQEKTREGEAALKSLEWYVNELDKLEAERKQRTGGK